MELPKSLVEAIEYFSDEQRCIDTVAHWRWPDGKPTCPDCGNKEPYYLASQKRWKCRNGKCGRQFSVKVGTIFEDSPISLKKWLPAMWLLANCKNGISSHELSRDLKVTQKTAWFILQRIRLVMHEEHTRTIGSHWGNPIEVDETFVGGKVKNMHRSRANKIRAQIPIDRLKGYETSLKNKTVVMGLLNRETRQVRAKVIPNVKRETLQAEILKNVGFNAHVYTDQAVGYDGLNKNVKNFTHRTTNHLTEYVRGRVHTQGIENFWSLLKRGLNGTYVAVEPFHLDRYVAEQVFRFNNRATKDNPLTDADRFALVLSRIADKRITYAQLTGKVQERQF
jgi:transposase-like protein